MKITLNNKNHLIDNKKSEAQVRTWVANWTPGRIRSLEYDARAGVLTTIGDLCDMLLTDDRIRAVLGVRVNGLLALPIEFHMNEPYGSDDKPKVIQGLEEDFWNIFPESSLSELTSWALLVGVGIGQHVWEKNKETGRLEPKLEVWHPSNTGFDFFEDSWFVKTKNGKQFIKGGEGNWIIHAPFGLKRPWTWGLWRILSRWWLLKQYAITDWARHSEAHGKPAYVVTTTDEQVLLNKKIKESRQQVVTDLQNIGDLQAMALPFGLDVKLLEASTTANVVFSEQISYANDGIAIAILGQNLTTSVSGGSLAAARVHEEVRSDIKEFDEQSLTTSIHNQSIKWWTAMNYGKKQEVPWVRWKVQAPEDENVKAQKDKARAETMVEVMKFIKEAKGVGVPIDISAIAELFDIPLAKVIDPEPESIKEEDVVEDVDKNKNDGVDEDKDEEVEDNDED